MQHVSFQHAISLVAVLALPACVPPPTSSSPVTPAAIVTPSSSQAPDLSPVAEPSGIVALTRLRNLQSTLHSVERVLRLPLSLESEFRALLRERDADVFQLNAGIDLALVLDPKSKDDDPKVLGAVSFPIADLEHVRSVVEREFEVTPLVPGVYRIAIPKDEGVAEEPEKSGSLIDDFDFRKRLPEGRYCDLAASLGDSPARLVCSETERELDMLRPWMTRGLPREVMGDGDFHGEIRMGPLRDRYLPVARTQALAAGFLAKRWLENEWNLREPRLLRIPDQLLREGLALFEDVDRISIDGKLDAETSEMSFRGKISFRSKTAWLTQVYTSANAEQGLAPEAFWRLPKDADTASYTRSADPGLYEGVHETTRLLLSDLLTRTPISPATSSAIDAFLAAMPMHKATVVTAQGGTSPAWQLPGAKAKSNPTPREAVRSIEELVNSSVGWSIVGIDAPSAAYADWLRKGVVAYEGLVREGRANPDIGKTLRDARWVPKARVRNQLPGYPRGSVGVDLTVQFDSRDIWTYSTGAKGDPPAHPAGPAVAGSITLRWVVVPEGANRTWIGFSTDSKILQQKVGVVLAKAGRDATIGSLEGLDPLRRTPTVGGGFFSYGNLLSRTVRGLDGTATDIDKESVDKLLASFPHGFRTPVLVLYTGTGGSAPSNELEFRVQRGTVEDLAGFVQFALSPEGRKVLEKLDSKAPDGEEDP
jgi:hypothetical protein